MNYSDINNLAKEAGLWVPPAGIFEGGALVRFFYAAYNAGADSERESCAKVLDLKREMHQPNSTIDIVLQVCANAIRSRSNT